MDRPRKYIAFFDLDMSILNINSGTALVMEAFRSGLMDFSGLIRSVYYSILYKLKLRDPVIIIRSMTEWLKGIPQEEISSFSKKVVDKHLKKAIRPEIFTEIDYHRENNAEVVILSSVMMDICRHMGNHLGMDNIICTLLEVIDGVCTGLPETRFCFREEKKVRLLDYCKLHNYDLADSYYYGDSIADLPALEIVGNPVCISPDRQLRKVARKRNWRICNW